jgi:capsular polysaccharide biosynthesis protein
MKNKHMTSSLFYLMLKDYFTWLKFPLNAILRRHKIFKKSVSRCLRISPKVRDMLHLPSRSSQGFLSWCSFNQCNDQWIETEPASHFIHSLPKTNHPENLWYFRDNSQVNIDASGLALLHNAYVHGHNGGQYLNSSKDFLWDLGRENWKYFDAFYMDSVWRLPAPVHLAGTVAVLADEYAYNNFSHWVFDVLPKIDVLKKANLFDRVDWFLVGHASRPFQLDTLSRLCIPLKKVIQLTDSSFFRADSIAIPRLCGYNRQHYPARRLEVLANFFSDRTCNSKPSRKLFISRSDASFRHLIGEDELMKKLDRHGFERISLSGLPLANTVDLFMEAKAVIGPFGSGLMNIAFCQPRTAVVEIASPSFYNCYHWYLSGVRRLRHAVYFGNNGMLNPDKPPNQLTNDIKINAQSCYEFICDYLREASPDLL